MADTWPFGYKTRARYSDNGWYWIGQKLTISSAASHYQGRYCTYSNANVSLDGKSTPVDGKAWYIGYYSYGQCNSCRS